MHKHILDLTSQYKPISPDTELISDPFDLNEKSKTCEHEYRNHANKPSQKSLKIEENKT